jgi:hypothetical protein
LGKAFFGSRGSQRHAVEQNLAPRSTQQQSRVTAVVKRRAQLFPRGLELRHRAHVPELIKACEFQQNVQAANKRAS